LTALSQSKFPEELLCTSRPAKHPSLQAIFII
jgi:hypothetical protein